MALEIIDILFLPMLFFIGIITSREDYRTGKVRNQWIILGIFWGLSIIILFFIWNLIASPVTHFYYFQVKDLPSNLPVSVFTFHYSFLVKSLINFFIAIVVSFFLWRFNAWAAGDAKLFIVYSLLIPLKYYWKSYIPYFPSFILLINIFIPFFLYLFARSCLYYLKFIYLRITKSQAVSLIKSNNDSGKGSDSKKTKEHVEKGGWKEKIKSRTIIFFSFISIFLIFELFQEPIEKYISVDISTLRISLRIFILAALIIFSDSLFKLFQKPLTFKIIIVTLFVILGYGFFSSPGFTWQILCQALKMMVIFMVFLGLFRGLINFYLLKTSLKEVKIADLRPKMNLDEKTIGILKEDKEYYDKYIGRIHPDGLTLEQAKAIKEWFQKSDKYKALTVNIYKPFPFVVWMFIGVIATIIWQKSLINIVIEIVKRYF